MATQLARRYLFSVERYEQMVKSGIFTPDDKVELIAGEIVKKMSIGPRHAGKVDEVAASSSADDRAGIAEVWLFDVGKNRREIYTQPLNGEYQVTRIVTRDDVITLQLLPEVTINASDLLS
jgi:Uma2 family endonuclease